MSLLVAGGVALALTADAHPTDRELREAQTVRAKCESQTAPAERVDPVRLGMSEATLHTQVGVLRRDPVTPPVAAVEEGATAGPVRWTRVASGELTHAEYDVWQDRVYRIRWRLAARYERPVLDALFERARICFGAPDFDQTFEAEPGSAAATLRRIGWTHGDRSIELRQLHPLHGGPVYLSVTSRVTLRELGAAAHARLPEPDRSGPWWKRAQKPLEIVTTEERKALGDAFMTLLSQLDH